MMPSRTRFRVSATGAAGIAPGARTSAASSAGTVPGGITGRAASCTRTNSGANGSSASNPARTLSWRVAPPSTMGRCGNPSSAAAIEAGSPTGCRVAPAAISALAAWRITGSPRSVRNCLGVSAPKRLPVPAATRMAARCIGAHKPGAGGGSIRAAPFRPSRARTGLGKERLFRRGCARMAADVFEPWRGPCVRSGPSAAKRLFASRAPVPGP